MPFRRQSGLKIAAIICGLFLLPAGAVWSVDNYVNQDGSPHLYNAYLILEILRGNPEIESFAAINPVLVPNLSGHWMLAGLLVLFEPLTASKIFVTLLLWVSAGSILWLRRQIAGDENVLIGALYALALAFNWMWFLGFYNFILGAAGFAFTLGLWWRWRERFNAARCFVLFLLLLFVFTSHLISYAVLAGLLVVLGLDHWRAKDKRALFWTAAAIAPTVPFVFNYLRLSRASDRLAPIWNYVDDPFSPAAWLLQWRAADPFQLLSRKALPFIENASSAFGVFSPTVWLLAAVLCLVLSIAFWRREERGLFLKERGVWLVFFCGLVFLWAFAPDGFGKSHGAYLRERLLLLGLICLAPVFRFGEQRRTLKTTAAVCLSFVFVFQSLVLWDYARFSDRVAGEILPARSFVGADESLASIAVNRDGCRFKPLPRGQATALLLIGKNGRLWDNYELGYYLFPVVARDAADRAFIYEFRESNTFDFCDANERVAEKSAKLKELLAAHRERIDVLVRWGGDERLDVSIEQWYGPDPFFDNGAVRLYRRQASASNVE